VDIGSYIGNFKFDSRTSFHSLLSEKYLFS